MHLKSPYILPLFIALPRGNHYTFTTYVCIYKWLIYGMVWHVLKLHINGSILYISSFYWFFSHLPLFVRCILLEHVVIVYLFSLLYNIPLWKYHSLFFLSIFAHLHWFPHVAIINLLQWVFLAHVWESFITASWTGNCWVEGHVYL